MPYLLTDEQRQIRDEAERVLAAAYSGARLKGLLERKGRYDEAYWRTCGEMGWTAATIPEAHGGLGLGPIELGLIASEAGRTVCGAPFLASSFAVSEAVWLFGDDAQLETWLPTLATGEVKGLLALGEGPGDPVPAHPSVRFAEGRLTGAKSWVVGGAAADVAVVLAADPDGAPCLALAALSHGVVTRAVRDTFDNSRCVADLEFAGAPATALAAPDAMQAAWSLLARQALVTAFEQIGGAEACMRAARDYAVQRYAFGQPIGRFQAIKHKVAEMYVAIELARGAAERAALELARGAPDFSPYAAAARLAATTAYELATGEAIQVHGALGATWEHDLHLHYRRARSTAVELGGAAAWQDRIVAALQAA